MFKKSIPNCFALLQQCHRCDAQGYSVAGSVTVGGRLSASHVTGKGFTNGMTPTHVIKSGNRVSVAIVMYSVGEIQMPYMKVY